MIYWKSASGFVGRSSRVPTTYPATGVVERIALRGVYLPIRRNSVTVYCSRFFSESNLNTYVTSTVNPFRHFSFPMTQCQSRRMLINIPPGTTMIMCIIHLLVSLPFLYDLTSYLNISLGIKVVVSLAIQRGPGGGLRKPRFRFTSLLLA